MKILKSRYRSREEFLESYSKDSPNGALFCPTTTTLEEGDDVVVEIHFPELPNKTLVRGKVVWWRAALPRLRVRAGALVSFAEDDKDTTAFVLAIASGEEVEAIRRRHPRIPVSLDIRWRSSDSSTQYEGHLHDISIGGALLLTEGPVKQDDDLIIEITTPGAAQSMDIAAKATHVSPAGTGVRFIYRDGGGSQRLREVVRRLIARG